MLRRVEAFLHIIFFTFFVPYRYLQYRSVKSTLFERFLNVLERLVTILNVFERL